MSSVCSPTVITESTCPLCNTPAETQRIEILPDNGVIEIAVHGKSVCRWVTYDNLNDAFSDIPRSNKPVHMKCPKCGKKGTIGYNRHDGMTNKLNIIEIRYYVNHKKSKRCTTFTQSQRDCVLKRLGRYISTPKYKI